MPLYEFMCKKCDTHFDRFLSINDRHEPTKQECPSCTSMTVVSCFGTPPIADPVRMGRIKPSEGFRDLLKQIKKRNPGSTLDIN